MADIHSAAMTNDEAACRTLIAGTFFKTKVVIMKHFHILTAPICPSQLVNLRDTGGATPLHLAAATNRYKRKNFFIFTFVLRLDVQNLLVTTAAAVYDIFPLNLGRENLVCISI